MKLSLERGTVAAVVSETTAGRELLVEVGGELERAYQEPSFGGAAQVGDTVLLNTTAVRLKLGTGGVHFVVAVEKAECEGRELEEESVLEGGTAGEERAFGGEWEDQPGHIMKLRYTPLQMAVHAVEELDHPLHEAMQKGESLEGIPIVICELHSMVPAVAMSLRYAWDKHNPTPPRIAYVMTDGAALPMSFSKTIAHLKQLGLLAGTVTVGHAYGGDLEAVNLYSGLLAARHALQADCILVAMGPGIVGTGTRYGHTGIEVGQAVNAVHTLEGDPVVVPRISFADKRERHQGISHHTLTALGKVALAPATIPLPNLSDDQAALIWRQLTAAGLHQKHRLAGLSGNSVLDAVKQFPVPLRTMGRTLHEDLPFFLAAGAAGEWAARHMKKPPKHHAWRSEAALLTDKN